MIWLKVFKHRLRSYHHPQLKEEIKLYKDYTFNGKDKNPLLIIAHGAGADSQSDFMTDMASRIANEGIYVVRFDFPYMIKRQEDGKKRPPDRAPKLIVAWQDIIANLARPCVIGGKSMGGRIASMVANDSEIGNLKNVDALIKGCVSLGYPFHPPGKPEKQRTSHLEKLRKPLLMVQGTRDTMGTKDNVAGYTLDKSIELEWLEDGNHDLKPRKASGFVYEHHLDLTAKAVAAFVKRQIG
ncbi:MAG: putative alpha/beta-hydrolase family hydrolase [Thalassolituus sp.]